MPSRQLHRGQHPEDARLFCDKQLPLLRRAVDDLSYLYTREYSDKAALKIVGDHYQLDARQRMALQRAACSDQARELRAAHVVALGELAGEILRIDGYNLLISVESALSGGILILARDGCIRDLASLHGSYRKVSETLPAIEIIGQAMASWRVSEARWTLDAPVANSGRLRALLLDEAERRGWAWEVELLAHPDKPLSESREIVVTADSWILDRVDHWANLMRGIIARLKPAPRVIDLSKTAESQPPV
jgi:hypothetical protein